MQLLPWKNPLVATAIQVKNRRGGLFATPVLYVLLLAVGGMGVFYYASWPQNRGQVQPALLYFNAVIILQLGVAVFLGGLRVASAIKAEVVNKTLDFQRLAAVSSWDIMAGKLFGEPALAYLLILASFPAALFCWILGLPGLSLPVLLLLYISLFTTAIMFGASSLQNTLVIPAGKASGGAVAGFGVLIGLGCMASFQLAAAGGANFYRLPWSNSLAGLFTPIPTLFALAHGDPWAAGLHLFGIEIPFLFVTPAAQLAAAALCLHIMARRLENLANPTLDKLSAYAFLLVVDFVTIGVLDSCATVKLGPRLALFAAIHVGASLVVIGCVTPGQETLLSWLWRFRGRRPRWLDEWLGDRTLNSLAVATCMLLLAAGALALAGLARDSALWTDEYLAQGKAEARAAADVLPRALLVGSAVIFAAGALYQWFQLAAGKYGTGIFFIALLLLAATPAALGIYEAALQKQDPPDSIWFAFTPAAHLIAWAGAPLALPSPWPVVGLYGALGALSLVGSYRRTARFAAAVDAKLAAMGVSAEEKPAAPA